MDLRFYSSTRPHGSNAARVYKLGCCAYDWGLAQAFTISTKPESGTCEEASCSKKEERGLPEMQEGTCQVHDDTLPESRMGMRGGLGGRRGWSSTPAKLGWRDGTCLLMYVLELMFNRLTMVT